VIEKMITKSGRMLKENGEYVNIADLLESIAEGATGDTKNLVEQLNRDVSALNAKLNGFIGTFNRTTDDEVTPDIYKRDNTVYTVGNVDPDGFLYLLRWDNSIRKTKRDGEIIKVLDAGSYMQQGETASLHCLLVSDTGRIIVTTNKGRCLVSDEAQTTLSEAFTFKSGKTSNTWGYDIYKNYVVLASYGDKNAQNPPREVYLSKDYGATWKLIFDKPIAEMIKPNDYHIHDVAIDHYNLGGIRLLISVGDTENRQILYSDDFGETWKEMFPESEWIDKGITPPIHPTSIICLPKGIAFGSDELPEGISWWNRPKNVENPDMRWEDCEYKIQFGDPGATIIGTLAVKGDSFEMDGFHYAVMPFRNHETAADGRSRLYVTGDGGNTWHQIYIEESDSSNYKGFMNVRLWQKTDGKLWIYGTYSHEGEVKIWRSKMPDFKLF